MTECTTISMFTGMPVRYSLLYSSVTLGISNNKVLEASKTSAVQLLFVLPQSKRFKLALETSRD
jgi:hypothetical protein